MLRSIVLFHLFCFSTKRRRNFEFSRFLISKFSRKHFIFVPSDVKPLTFGSVAAPEVLATCFDAGDFVFRYICLVMFPGIAMVRSSA